MTKLGLLQQKWRREEEDIERLEDDGAPPVPDVVFARWGGPDVEVIRRRLNRATVSELLGVPRIYPRKVTA